MAKPSRFISGLSTGRPLNPAGDLPLPFPFDTQLYQNDFNTYSAADWTVTASTGTTAVTAGTGGLITQTSAAVGNDVQANQLSTVGMFNVAPATPAWFFWRGNLADVVVPSAAWGLMQAASALVPTDGIYFTKAAGVTPIVLNIAKASAVFSVTLAGFTPVAGANFFLAWYYDGRPIPNLFAWAGTIAANPNMVGPPSIAGQNSFTNYFNSMVNITQTVTPVGNIPVANLSPIFGVKAQSAVAKTMVTDYVAADVIVAR